MSCALLALFKSQTDAISLFYKLNHSFHNFYVKIIGQRQKGHKNYALIVVGISKVKTHLGLDLHIFMTLFNCNQCFQNESKAIVFVYLFFLYLLTPLLKLLFLVLLSEIYVPLYLFRRNLTLHIRKKAVTIKTLTFTNKYSVTQILLTSFKGFQSFSHIQ